MSHFAESTVAEAAPAWLESIGRQVDHGLDTAPDMLAGERCDYDEVVLTQRLRDGLAPVDHTESDELKGVAANSSARAP